MSLNVFGEDRVPRLADRKTVSAGRDFLWAKPFALRLVALIWVLVLPQIMAAQTLAASDQAFRSDCSSSGSSVSGFGALHSSPLSRSAKIKPQRRPNFISHFTKARSGVPNDDEAADNSSDDDDDVWEELNARITSVELAIAWYPQVLRRLTCLVSDDGSVWSLRISPAPLTPRRLRC